MWYCIEVSKRTSSKYGGVALKLSHQNLHHHWSLGSVLGFSRNDLIEDKTLVSLDSVKSTVGGVAGVPETLQDLGHLDDVSTTQD